MAIFRHIETSVSIEVDPPIRVQGRDKYSFIKRSKPFSLRGATVRFEFNEYGAPGEVIVEGHGAPINRFGIVAFRRSSFQIKPDGGVLAELIDEANKILNN